MKIERDGTSARTTELLTVDPLLLVVILHLKDNFASDQLFKSRFSSTSTVRKEINVKERDKRFFLAYAEFSGLIEEDTFI